MEKRTNLSVIEEMLLDATVSANAEWVSYLTSQKDAILRARENKASKKSEEYAPIMKAIEDALKLADEPVRVGELDAPELYGLSTSKVTQAMKYLVEEGKVERFKGKKSYTYALVKSE